MKRPLTLIVALIVVAVACSDATETPPDPTAVAAEEYAGVWLFTHDPGEYMDALHTGTAEVRGSCLMVDGMVVVWHASQLERAKDLVDRIHGGDHPEVELGGGGFSVDEGASVDQFPTEIAERCDTIGVWFGAP